MPLGGATFDEQDHWAVPVLGIVPACLSFLRPNNVMDKFNSNKSSVVVLGFVQGIQPISRWEIPGACCKSALRQSPEACCSQPACSLEAFLGLSPVSLRAQPLGCFEV